MSTTPPVAFLKGHGTENDFVVIPDPDGRLRLTAAAVARICDRRAGVGGDGLIRVVRSAAEPEALAMADRAEWFMDYRNSDGSVAEMCGNGIRVFARALRRTGLVESGDLAVATRAGVRHVHIAKDAPAGGGGGSTGDGRPTGVGHGEITVSMGRALLSGPGPDGAVTVTVGDRTWPARQVDMGNPHAVAFVDDLAHAGDLRQPPVVRPADAYPDGVNVEFVTYRGPRHVAMRVHERGSGETRSCGTGACAAAVAAARRDGTDPAVTGEPVRYVLDVPGGRLVIDERPDGTVEMTGPAVIVAEGAFDADWLDTTLN